MTETKNLLARIYYAGFKHRAGGAFKHALETERELKRRGWQVEVITLDDLPIYARYLPTLVGWAFNAVRAPLGFFWRGRLTSFLYHRLLERRADLTIFEEIYISRNMTAPCITMLHATWSDNLQGMKVPRRSFDHLVDLETQMLNSITHPVVTVSEEYRHHWMCD